MRPPSSQLWSTVYCTRLYATSSWPPLTSLTTRWLAMLLKASVSGWVRASSFPMCSLCPPSLITNTSSRKSPSSKPTPWAWLSDMTFSTPCQSPCLAYPQARVRKVSWEGGRPHCFITLSMPWARAMSPASLWPRISELKMFSLILMP